MALGKMRALQLFTGLLLTVGLLLPACSSPPPASPPGPGSAGSGAAAKPAEPTKAPAAQPAAQPTAAAKPAATAAGTSEAAKTFNVAWAGQQTKAVDPHRESLGNWQQIWKNVYEPLLDVHEDSPNLVPLLARSWEVRDDAKTVIFNLRQGVKFQDGSDFDAEAVKFNLERVKALQQGPAYILATVNSVDVVDRYTVRINQRQSFLPIVAGMALIGMISPKSVKDNAAADDPWAEKWYASKGVGAGPYEIETVDLKSRVTFKKFPGYWGGWDGRHVDRVVLTLTPEAATHRLMIERGDADFAFQVNPDDLASLSKNPNIKVLTAPSSTQWILRMNMKGGPTADIRVRQALNYAWNYEAYKQSLNGLASPTDGPLQNELLGPEAKSTNPFKYDLQKAKALLAEAGYANGFTLNIYWQQGVVEAQRLTEVLQVELAKLGIKVQSTGMPYFSFVDIFLNWYQSPDPNKVPNMYVQFTQPRYPDIYSIAWLFYSNEATDKNTGRNYIGYNNPKLDDLFKRAAASTDVGKAKQLYAEAGQLIGEDVPDVFAAKREQLRLIRSNVHGVKLHPNYLEWLRFYPVYKD